MDAEKVDGLAEVGCLAVAEHCAWRERNTKRLIYRAWLKNYREQSGEWYEPGGDDDDEHDRLKADKQDAQRILSKARSATRRAIATMYTIRSTV